MAHTLLASAASTTGVTQLRRAAPSKIEVVASPGVGVAAIPPTDSAFRYVTLSATYNTVAGYDKSKKVETHVYGLEDPSVQRLQLCPGYDTAANRALLAKDTKAIVSGKIKLGS